MKTDKERELHAPLKGMYPLNMPGESVLVYTGPLGGLGDKAHSGVIELSCVSDPKLRWQMDTDDVELFPSLDPLELTVQRGSLQWKIPALKTGRAKGLINGVDRKVGDGMAARIISHWMNLPNLHGNEILHEVRIDGRTTWPGRWNLEIGQWRIILDGRSDHSAAFAESSEKPTYVLTHVMETSRADGLPFHHSEGAAFLEHLRVVFSFALGRWVAPILPVGLSSTGEIVWESWYPPICDPAAKVGQGWLHYHSREDFESFLRAALSCLEQDGSNGSLRFQMACAVQASHAGFLEQRMMTSFAALENLSWVILVLGGRISRTQYKNSRIWPGENRLRAILDLARITCDLAAYDVPSLTTFASMNGKADAPAALVEIRNRLVHPKSPRDDIYQIEDLVTDAWYLTRHYLVLLILHTINYKGSFMVQMPPFGWYGQTERVPWVAHRSAP